ncbi:hypothetical protein SUGI_0738050 [Cryptomeria japonica]|nr:hypothetical protein SUGI_0738050 [Cryptomeria japonica]
MAQSDYKPISRDNQVIYNQMHTMTISWSDCTSLQTVNLLKSNNFVANIICLHQLTLNWNACIKSQSPCCTGGISGNMGEDGSNCKSTSVEEEHPDSEEKVSRFHDAYYALSPVIHADLT